jgi:hypothetical protein
MSTTPNLDYASPGPNLRATRRYRRIALACALLPMLSGLLMLLLFWTLDWEWTVLAGMLLLPVGAVTVLVGLVFAGLWGMQLHAHARGASPPVPVGKIAGMFLLLLANFPVAYGCATVGIDLASIPRVVITVTNDSGALIDSCVIRSTWSYGSTALPPGASFTRAIRQDRAANLRVRLTQGGIEKEVVRLTSPSKFGDELTVKVKPRLGTEIHRPAG